MERIDFHDQIARNKRKSFFLILIVFAVLITLVYTIGLAIGTIDIFVISVLAIIISVTYITISYYNSDKIALASVGAKPAEREKYKQYYNSVEGLTIASGLPMPRLFVMPSSQINAFASGRNPERAVICVTEGALEKLDKNELDGVIAHELSHIANYDMRYMTLVAVMVGMISIVSQIFLRSLYFRGNSRGNDKGKALFLLVGIVLAILAPIVVYFVQLSISRKREFTADASAVKFTRYPGGLIRALEKIKQEHPSKENKKINKAIAPLFFASPFENLSSTHPPIEKRIEILKNM